LEKARVSALAFLFFNMNKYAIQIFWSEEDAAFVAVCREFPGLSAFGETREEAAHEVQTALDLMIETYRGKDISLSEPQSVLLAA
jgi:predicted RNase H-like HicB family nuclease